MYGPFHFICQGLLHQLTGLPVTHDVAGVICMVHWLGAASLLALAGGLMTRSAVLGLFIFMQATVHLSHVAREPGHPQEMVILALALAMVVVAARPLQKWAFPLLGMLGAALVCTKINVGAFFGFALLTALASNSSFIRSHRYLFWGLLALAASLPFLLMRRHLSEAWARDYSAVVCASVIATSAFSYILASNGRFDFREWLRTGIPFCIVSMLLLLAVLVNGTSLSGIVDSAVKLPAALPGNHVYSLIIPNSAWLAALALLTAAVALWFRASWQRFELAIAALKGCYGILGSLLLVTDCRIQLGYLLPWLWLALIQVPKNSSGPLPDLFPRALLCLLAAWQGLQAYPVAGTQVSVATFLAVLVYSLCAYDALLTLADRPRVQEHLRLMAPRTAMLLQGLVLAMLLHLFLMRWCMLPSRWAYYTAAPPIELRGASYLRLPYPQARTYGALAHYLEKECDTFIATPLLNSLYSWTDKRAPTWFNVSGSGIPSEDSQQAQVVAALQQAKRPLILVRESQVACLLGAQPTARGPLIRYIREDCSEVKRLSGFRILAPRLPADTLVAMPRSP